jgi:DNA-binding transcriptional regulator YdaS (Cro superfamily)
MVLGALGMPGGGGASGLGGGFNPSSFLNIGSGLEFAGGLATGFGSSGAVSAALIESGTVGFAGAGIEAAAGLGATGASSLLGPIGLGLAAFSLLGGGDLFGGSNALPEIPLGFSHPGVDQRRFSSDALYRRAAEQAEAQHRANFGITWTQPNSNNDGSPAAAVARDIEAIYEQLSATAKVADEAEKSRLKVLLEQVRATSQLADAVARFRADTDALKLADISPLTATERLDYARGVYTSALDAASAPDADAAALAALTGGRGDFLREAAGYYGTSSPAYRAIFDAAQAEAGTVIADLNARIGGEYGSSAEQLAAMGKSLEQLGVDIRALPERFAAAIERALSARSDVSDDIVREQTRQIVQATEDALRETSTSFARIFAENEARVGGYG